MTKKGVVAARTAAVKRRTFTREFKLKVIREVEAGKSQGGRSLALDHLASVVSAQHQQRGRAGAALANSSDRPGDARLRLSTDHRRTAPARPQS